MTRHRIDPALLLLWARVTRAGNLHVAAEGLFLTQPA
ncbi:LysR family transcriptional regulator, partial [Acidithiobacillus caldus]|nr:LysR family transcriptional regulator [Acidithiobacillus caldus]